MAKSLTPEEQQLLSQALQQHTAAGKTEQDPYHGDLFTRRDQELCLSPELRALFEQQHPDRLPPV